MLLKFLFTFVVVVIVVVALDVVFVGVICVVVVIVSVVVVFFRFSTGIGSPDYFHLQLPDSTTTTLSTLFQPFFRSTPNKSFQFK